MRKHLEAIDWSGLTTGRLQILQAFLQLATTYGYEGVSMRALGKSVNVKASSIYFHFPGGRDEIVAQSLRWHYFNWGTAILKSVSESEDVAEFWDHLVREHLRRQIYVMESDLWDIFVATDKICEFLQPETRQEVERWLELCFKLYSSVARELGYSASDASVRAVLRLLDGARSWCDKRNFKSDFEVCVTQALQFSRAILSVT